MLDDEENDRINLVKELLGFACYTIILFNKLKVYDPNGADLFFFLLQVYKYFQNTNFPKINIPFSFVFCV